MKKFVVYLLLFAMCISLFACGGGNGTETNEPEVTKGETNGHQESEAETEEDTTFDTDTDPIETEPKEDVSDTKEKETYPKTEATEGETETETEDPRLSMDYAPTLYYGAKELYNTTKDGIYGENAGLFFGYDEVKLSRDDDGTGYVRFLTYNDYNTVKEAYFSPISGPCTVAPFFVIKYRTTTQNIAAEIYCDSVNVSAGGSSGKAAFNYIADGEWHVEIVNLKRISNFDGKTLNYMRFDFMNAIAGVLNVDSYVEFAYMGFFSTSDDAMMFERGEVEKVVYIDPESGYSESKINHATLIDMINGQNETGIGTYSYRGGNSLAGIDTFMFNNTTFDGGMLVFSGWTVIEGGVEKFVWSADGGKTWNDCVLYKATALGNGGKGHFDAVKNLTGVAIIDTENSARESVYHGDAGATTAEARSKGVACDLSAYAGRTVNVVFAAVPKAESADKKLSLIAYVKGVEVVMECEEETVAPPEVIEPEIEPDNCREHEISVEWHPVIGELKEQKLCRKCGEVLEERATATRLSVDFIIDKNGNAFEGSKLGWYGANKVIENVDASNMVLRDGYDFVVQGWIGINCGAQALVFRVNGGEWIACQQKPEQASQAVINAIEGDGLGFVRYADATGYRVSVPLKDYAGQTVKVEFGVTPRNNPEVVICFLSLVNVNVPELAVKPDTPAEEDIKFMKAIDKLYVGDNLIDNPANAYGGKLFEFDASSYDITSNCSVSWRGWVGISGGVTKYVYSVDGGLTWNDINGGYGDITRDDVKGVLSSGGFTDFVKNGSLADLKVDLSGYIGKTVDVIIAAVPVTSSDKAVQMVKLTGIKVTGTCTHLNTGGWSHVEGELRESAVCACGETVTRDVKYFNNIDVIEGTLNGAAHSVNPPDGIGLVSRPADSIDSRNGRDIVVQGWLAVNGGVNKYVYSIDGGETWLDCGNQPSNEKDGGFVGSTGHENAINGADLGFSAADADLRGRYRVTCNLSSKAGETVTVLFGVILEENQTAVPLQILEVTVNVLP